MVLTRCLLSFIQMEKVQPLTRTGTATGTIHYNYVLQKVDHHVLSNRDATVQF